MKVFDTENLTHCWFAGFFLGDESIDSLNKGSLHLSKKDIHLLYFIADHFGFPSSRVISTKKSCKLNFSKGFILNLQETFQIHRTKSYGDVVFPQHFDCSLRAIEHQRQNLVQKIQNSTKKRFKNSSYKYTPEEVLLIHEVLNSCET